MKLISLASGSSGNSFLVQSNGSAILIDAGLSAKRILERLCAAAFDPGYLKAIIVSHGHSDHTKGVGTLSRKLKIPVWMNEGTYLESQYMLGKVHSLEFFSTGRIFEVAGFKVHAFSVPHDAADPVGFRISHGVSRLGIATDFGVVTHLIANLLTGLQVVVLESNHDPKMLMEGPYPVHLKQRVRGRTGHLSNPDSAKLLQSLVNDELHTIMLAHMSETNNTPSLALECAGQSLNAFFEQNGALCCAYQHAVSAPIEW